MTGTNAPPHFKDVEPNTCSRSPRQSRNAPRKAHAPCGGGGGSAAATRWGEERRSGRSRLLLLLLLLPAAPGAAGPASCSPRLPVPPRPAPALTRRAPGRRGAMAQRRAAERGPCQTAAAAESARHQRQLLEGAGGSGRRERGLPRPGTGRCPERVSVALVASGTGPVPVPRALGRPGRAPHGPCGLRRLPPRGAKTGH